MPLTVAIDQADAGQYRVKLGGSLDSETTPQLESRVEPLLADPHARVIRLEVHDLHFISSMGLGAVARMRRIVTSRGGVVLMVGAQPQIAKVFQLVKMLPKEVVFATRQEADEYLAAIQKQVIEQQDEMNPGN
jgi:stage II sporulation protein AA (anti-sigma F factor antagonist)